MFAIPAQAATEDEIEESINAGIAWLAAQQNLDGSWVSLAMGEPVACTGFALAKLLDRGWELAKVDPDIDNPFDPDYAYSSNIEHGLAYLFTQAAPHASGGICFAIGAHETYSTGVAMMAIAATRDPVRMITTGPFAGAPYQFVMDGCVTFFTNTQNPDGGWRYWAGNQPSDQSNTGYAVLGLRYAEDFGCAIPASIKTGLDPWIDYIQNDVDGDPNDGGAGYAHPDQWVNILKTGNLLFQMAFVGDKITDQRVQDAIDYIVRHWNDANQDPGWKGPPVHCQAAYCLMKGLEAFDIRELDTGSGPFDWFDEMSTIIISAQWPAGFWPWDVWGDELLATEWALLALERIVPNRPPNCSQAYATPDCLWPPNHKFVDISIMGVTDPDGDPITITVLEIWSDEPTATDVGSGGAKHSPDATGVGTDTPSVRSERSGNGDGRVYVIIFQATDDQGGVCEGKVAVKVPHDQSDECEAIWSGPPKYDATGIN
jgi:hypothetical protein